MSRGAKGAGTCLERKIAGRKTAAVVEGKSAVQDGIAVAGATPLGEIRLEDR